MWYVNETADQNYLVIFSVFVKYSENVQKYFPVIYFTLNQTQTEWPVIELHCLATGQRCRPSTVQKLLPREDLLCLEKKSEKFRLPESEREQDFQQIINNKNFTVWRETLGEI